MLYQFVVHFLNQIGTAVAQLRKEANDILHQVEAVDLILHAHIKRRGDSAFLLVAIYMEITVRPSVGQLVNQGMVAVECENDRLIFRKQGLILYIAQAVRVLSLRFR